MTNPAIIAWIESAPAPFEASNMMGVWRKAYADIAARISAALTWDSWAPSRLVVTC